MIRACTAAPTGQAAPSGAAASIARVAGSAWRATAPRREETGAPPNTGFSSTA